MMIMLKHTSLLEDAAEMTLMISKKFEEAAALIMKE